MNHYHVLPVLPPAPGTHHDLRGNRAVPAQPATMAGIQMSNSWLACGHHIPARFL